jgi:hypothetical protein
MKTKIFTASITLICAVIFLTGNASAAFATNESGISAYVNVGSSINLGQAAGAYKTTEANTSTYIIGIVEVPNATDYEQPHVYTSSDGWIMAYYAKEKPRALIMPWGQFDRNNPDLSQLSNTRLEEAISKVSSSVGVTYSTIKSNTKYYDFQFPEANSLTLISKSRAYSGIESFSFRVPNEFTLFNASWEYYSYDSCDGSLAYGACGYNGGSRSYFLLDGIQLSGIDGVSNHNSVSDGGNLRDEKYFGTINGLKKDFLYKGDLYYYPIGSDEGSSNIAIALIYKAP